MGTFRQWTRSTKVFFPLYVCGADAALRGQVVQDVIAVIAEQCRKCDQTPVAVVNRVDAKSPALFDIISHESACCTNLVIVSDGHLMPQRSLAKLMAWIDAAPRGLALVFQTDQTNVKASEEPLVTFRRKGSFVECKPLKGAQIAEFVVDRLPRIEPAAVEYLVATVQSMAALLNEIRKLEFVPDVVPLSKAFVAEFCSPTVELFADALMSANKRVAFQAIPSIGSNDYNRIIGLLEWTVTRVVILCAHRGMRISYTEMAQVAKVPDWRLKKFLEWAHEGMVRWLHRVDLIASTDNLVRRGNVVGVLERLIWLW